MHTRNIIFESCCKTDIGKIRSRNEDVCYADSKLQCYLVADGMGGSAGGDVASSLFRQATDEVFSDSTPQTPDDAVGMVRSCFDLAHKKIHGYVDDKPEYLGMGCTADVLTFQDGNYIIGHVGDSRTYLYLENQLTQLTTDHSLVHEQVSQGLISSEEAGSSRYRNVLIQAVGVDMEIDVDIYSEPALPDSHFLICSDGLYTMVGEEEIAAVLAYKAPLSLKAEMLVNMANDAGGKDNIAVTIVHLKTV